MIRGYCRCLAPLGHRIVVSRSLREARQAAAAWKGEPCACALLEEVLEDGHGTDLLPLPSSVVAQQSVAIVSGFIDASVALRAAAMHALAVPKPVDRWTLVTLVKLLERRAHERAARPLFPAAGAEFEKTPRARRFDPFVLHGHHLATPSGVLQLRPGEAELLAYLVDAAGNPLPAKTIALDLYLDSRDGGEQLVRRHIANLRRTLGVFSALISRSKSGGYRIATELFRSEERALRAE